MHFLIILASFLVAVHCSAIPLNFNHHDDNLDEIINRAETFFETLPKKIQEDAKLLIPELVQKYGYRCERHKIITSDGYILEMHRIPYGRSGKSENRPVVILQHGLLSSSADWVIAGPGQALAYILADAGYDVWMSNARGTRYSRKHIHLDPDKNKKEFFHFSWHEIATLDLPASIDYILAHTKQEKLFYIGHSQGTTVSYIFFAEKPEFNDKFRAVFSFAPTAYLSNMRCPMRLLGPHVPRIEKYFEARGKYEAISTNNLIARVGQTFCNDNSIFQVFCTNFIFLISGFNPQQMNATLLPVVLGHTPAGASLRQPLHYGQVFNSGIFRQWDYGLAGNQEHYGSDTPPEYQLKNIKAPFHLFYSVNDWLGNVTDVMHLYEQLPNAELHLVSDNKFNHIDYLYAINAPKVVYEKVLSLMKEY